MGTQTAAPGSNLPISWKAVAWVVASAWFVSMIIGGIFVRGWAVLKVWGWFIVPFFHLPNIPLTTAMGFSLLLLVLHPSVYVRIKDTGYTSGQKIRYAMLDMLVVPLIQLLIAYIVHLYS